MTTLRVLFSGIYKLCECSDDCKAFIPFLSKHRGLPAKFKRGHNSKGELNNNYTGGRYPTSDGYWEILIPKDCNSKLRRKGRYIKEHIYFYEQYYNVCILPWIEINHKNGDKGFNIPYMNLELLTKPEHTKFHHPKLDTSDRCCSNCGSKETYFNEKHNVYKWTKDGQGGYWCNKCARKMYRRKKSLNI